MISNKYKSKKFYLDGKNKNGTVNLLMWIFIFFPLIILISISLSPIYTKSFDYENYLNLFSNINNHGLEYIYIGRAEPLFVLLINYGLALGMSGATLYALPLSVSLSVKLLALRNIPSSKLAIFLTIIFYISRYLPIHELTQIRASLACGFILLSWTTRKTIPSILFLGLAFLLHYSSLVVIPFIFTKYIGQKIESSNNYKKYILYLSIIPVIFITYYLLQNLNSAIILTSNYSTGLDLYVERGFGDEKINLLSKPILLDMIFSGFAVISAKSYQANEKKLSYIILYSLIIFIGLANFPVLAFRIREMFSILLIPTVMSMMNGFRLQRIATLIYISISSIYYFYLFFYSKNAIFT